MYGLIINKSLLEIYIYSILRFFRFYYSLLFSDIFNIKM